MPWTEWMVAQSQKLKCLRGCLAGRKLFKSATSWIPEKVIVGPRLSIEKRWGWVGGAFDKFSDDVDILIWSAVNPLCLDDSLTRDQRNGSDEVSSDHCWLLLPFSSQILAWKKFGFFLKMYSVKEVPSSLPTSTLISPFLKQIPSDFFGRAPFFMRCTALDDRWKAGNP